MRLTRNDLEKRFEPLSRMMNLGGQGHGKDAGPKIELENMGEEIKISSEFRPVQVSMDFPKGTSQASESFKPIKKRT